MLNDDTAPDRLRQVDTLVLWSLLGTTEMLLDPASVNVSESSRDAAVTLQSRLLVELSRRGLTMNDRPVA